MQRVEMFWREPEKAVRQALRSQLRDAMAAQGLDIAKLRGNRQIQKENQIDRNSKGVG